MGHKIFFSKFYERFSEEIFRKSEKFYIFKSLSGQTDVCSKLLIVHSLIVDFNEKDNLSFGRKVTLFSCLHRSEFYVIDCEVFNFLDNESSAS